MSLQDIQNLRAIIAGHFTSLSFDEATHTYIESHQILPSVSSIVKSVKQPFDVNKVAFYSARKQGRLVEEVKREWNALKVNGLNIGTNFHLFAELCFKNYIAFYDDWEHIMRNLADTPQKLSLIDLWKEKPDYLYPLTFELRMFHPLFRYAGTCDLLFLDLRDGSLVLGDYKTNKEMFKWYNDYLKPPLNFLPQTEFNAYSCQLSLYALILEYFGYTVSNMIIFWMKREGGYKPYNAKDLKDNIYQMLESQQVM